METLTFEQLPSAVCQLSKKLENIERLLQTKVEHQTAVPEDILLTVRQTADYLNLSIPTIYSKVSRHELPVMKSGKLLYFSRNELLDTLKAGRKKTNAEIETEAESYIKRG